MLVTISLILFCYVIFSSIVEVESNSPKTLATVKDHRTFIKFRYASDY
jgi:hypothetical protein